MPFKSLYSSALQGWVLNWSLRRMLHLQTDTLQRRLVPSVPIDSLSVVLELFREKGMQNMPSAITQVPKMPLSRALLLWALCP